MQMFQQRPEPSCPEYANAYNRLRSFDGRPLPAGQTAESLANAGFFYIGQSICMSTYVQPSLVIACGSGMYRAVLWFLTELAYFGCFLLDAMFS